MLGFPTETHTVILREWWGRIASSIPRVLPRSRDTNQTNRYQYPQPQIKPASCKTERFWVDNFGDRECSKIFAILHFLQSYFNFCVI